MCIITACDEAKSSKCLNQVSDALTLTYKDEDTWPVFRDGNYNNFPTKTAIIIVETKRELGAAVERMNLAAVPKTLHFQSTTFSCRYYANFLIRGRWTNR